MSKLSPNCLPDLDSTSTVHFNLTTDSSGTSSKGRIFHRESTTSVILFCHSLAFIEFLLQRHLLLSICPAYTKPYPQSSSVHWSVCSLPDNLHSNPNSKPQQNFFKPRLSSNRPSMNAIRLISSLFLGPSAPSRKSVDRKDIKTPHPGCDRLRLGGARGGGTSISFPSTPSLKSQIPSPPGSSEKATSGLGR